MEKVKDSKLVGKEIQNKMSWTDKAAVKHICELRDIFKVNTLVETGTFKGITAKLQSGNFKKVLTCELVKEYYDASIKKLKDNPNVSVFHMDSSEFITDFIKRYKREGRTDYILFFLDAHFYDPQLKPEDRFVVLKELKALKDFNKAIIVVHDFDNNLGHITYDGQPLDLELMQEDLLKVNPNFKFYTNELGSCDIVTKQEVIDGEVDGLEPDFPTLDNLEYLWATPRLTYRGLLYCTPNDIIVNGLRKWK